LVTTARRSIDPFGIAWPLPPDILAERDVLAENTSGRDSMAEENPTEGMSASELEMLYRGILQNALDCIITMDAKGRVLEFNPAAERVFGYTREEAIGAELAELIIPARMREQHRRGLARFLETGEGPVIGRRIEIEGLRKDGSEICVELAITALKIDSAPVFTAYLRDISDRRRAEDEREKFIALVEQSDDFIGMGSLDGNIIYINRGGCQLVGLDPAQAPGTPIAAVHPEKWWLKLRDEIFPAVASGEKNWFGEAQLRNVQTNEPIDVLMNIFTVRHPVSGGVICYATVMRDISERKRSEAASRHLAAIVESSDDAIASKDLNGIVTSWNAGAERVFGYNAAEMIGKPIQILVPPERYNEEPGILERIRRGEYIEVYETVRRRKDGRLINVSLTVSPIKTADGRVIGASKIARDITDRVLRDRRRLAQYTVASLLAGSWTLEEASSAILQTIASIGDWVLSALWIYDEAAGVLRCPAFWEAGSEELKNFGDRSRAIEFPMGVGLPGRVWESNKPAWIRDVAADTNFPRAAIANQAGLHGGFAFPLFTGQAVNGVIEMFSRGPVEPDRDLLQLVAALGSQIGMFIERRRIERELQREKENAEAANAAKDRFLATLSHELRTPLTPVLIWAGGTVNQPGLSPDLHEGLKMVCRNVELEARLIDDLLDLTRLSRGKLQLQLSSADAHELVRHSIEIVRKDIEDRHLRLTVALEAPSHQVNVDPPRLQQVFWNVLRNACKFTPEHGAISVRSLNRRPDLIAIEIRDTGVGIPPELLEKIFEAFEQVDRAREGLGLGLAISKAIVEMHGGRIRAQSEGSGKGSTFTIELPASATPA
jgi:PAS domain S-box-containing protein